MHRGKNACLCMSRLLQGWENLKSPFTVVVSINMLLTGFLLYIFTSNILMHSDHHIHIGAITSSFNTAIWIYIMGKPDLESIFLKYFWNKVPFSKGCLLWPNILEQLNKLSTLTCTDKFKHWLNTSLNLTWDTSLTAKWLVNTWVVLAIKAWCII